MNAGPGAEWLRRLAERLKSELNVPLRERLRRPNSKRWLVWSGLGVAVLAVVLAAARSGIAPSPGTSAEPERIESADETPDAMKYPPATSLGVIVPSRDEAQVVYAGPGTALAVGVTFDTGVAPGKVPQVLDLLKKYNRYATFGVTGEWAVTNPSLLKRIVDEGHAVINHSWSHPSFTGEDTETEPLSAEDIVDQLARTEEKIQEIAGVSTMPYFRPPYGDYDSRVNRIAKAQGYDYNVLWTVDGLGWDGSGAKYVKSVTFSNARPGAIYLYHTDNPTEASVLEEIIQGLEEKNLMMVTVPQLLGHEPMPDYVPLQEDAPSADVLAEDALPVSPAGSAGAAGTSQPPQPTPTPAGYVPTPTPTPLPVTPVPSATPTVGPTPTPVPMVTLAQEDFETGNGEGGAGWATPWWASSLALTETAPDSQSYFLDMAATGIAMRWIDLDPDEPVNETHLRFRARFDGLEAGDEPLVRLSDDGLDWKAYKLVLPDPSASATPEGSAGATPEGMQGSAAPWYLFDIVVPLAGDSEHVFVEFRTAMSPANDVWDVDDIELRMVAP
ncbi:MAG: polysaccharide deacetylase family protein [Dehalococcoidia bacterium]